MMEALQYDFMRNALCAGVLVSLACGIIGTFVVVNRIVFIAGGIAHTAYGGIGLGYFFNFNPLLGAVAFSTIAGLAMGIVQRQTRERTDTTIGVMWAVGMAVGIILVDLTPGYKADLMSYLFGSILTVPTGDLQIMLGFDAIAIALVVLFYKELVAISFDETFATIQNVPMNGIYFLLLGEIALTVVMMMQVVGLILTIALLTIPAAISTQLVRDLKQMMAIASLLGVLFTFIGLWLSYTLNLTSGATIILVSGTAYLSILALKWRSRRSACGPIVK